VYRDEMVINSSVYRRAISVVHKMGALGALDNIWQAELTFSQCVFVKITWPILLI